MSQCMCVQYLASLDDEARTDQRRVFEQISRALADAGVGPFHEEEDELTELSKLGSASVPYDWVWRLRRAAAYAIERHPFLPAWGPETSEEDEAVLSAASSDISSHLISLWDTATIFVPVDFVFPIELPEGGPREGFVSSSHGLLRELRLIAPLIGITFAADGSLTSELVAAIRSERGGGPLGPERAVWLLLFVLARESIALRSALVFH